MALTPIGELAQELRYLNVERQRALLASRRGNARATSRWRRVAAKYDRLLLEAAEMLGVQVVRLPKERRALGTKEREALEAALAEAGLDVVTTAKRRRRVTSDVAVGA